MMTFSIVVVVVLQIRVIGNIKDMAEHDPRKITVTLPLVKALGKLFDKLTGMPSYEAASNVPQHCNTSIPYFCFKF